MIQDIERRGCGWVFDLLNHSRGQAHLWHLQATTYGMHKALEVYYEGIVPLLDEFIESYMGHYQVVVQSVDGYRLENLVGLSQVVGYFDVLSRSVDEFRQSLDCAALQNILDEVLALIGRVLYLLTLCR